MLRELPQFYIIGSYISMEIFLFFMKQEKEEIKRELFYMKGGFLVHICNETSPSTSWAFQSDGSILRVHCIEPFQTQW
jgi:hypothetical protein